MTLITDEDMIEITGAHFPSKQCQILREHGSTSGVVIFTTEFYSTCSGWRIIATGNTPPAPIPIWVKITRNRGKQKQMCIGMCVVSFL
ncbi:DUF4224 domain-containing protein [Cedecea sp.]|uniref:DUF4224 domain-containing protein n=1 Tax=Cedecea sp. TaxID=1970739 RepID=UPI0039C87BE4